MRDHLTPLFADSSWPKWLASCLAWLANMAAAVTFDGAYKALLFTIGVAQLVWLVVQIRGRSSSRRRRSPR